MSVMSVTMNITVRDFSKNVHVLYCYEVIQLVTDGRLLLKGEHRQTEKICKKCRIYYRQIVKEWDLEEGNVSKKKRRKYKEISSTSPDDGTMEFDDSQFWRRQW